MTIAVLKELQEARVVLDPTAVAKLKELGVAILVEKGAGESSFFQDQDYAAAAQLVDREQALSQADLLLSIQPIPTAEWPKMKPKACMLAQFAPFNNKDIITQLQSAGYQALSLDMIPRTTLAQSMDVLSSMASIAGYRSVLTAVYHLPRYFPMMITAAGSIRPAKVLVLGAGVAGLQAIATARRLGAQVEAFDTRSAAKEEVQSLGAKFVEVAGAVEDKAAGGYGVEQSEDYIKRQRAEVQARAMKADVIITTAQVRGRKAPILVPRSTVDQMQAGSVIVDLAASTGGNCELTKDTEIVQYNGVKIIGNSNLAATMPQDASRLYSNNVFNFLKYILKDGQLALHTDNEILQGAWITAPVNDVASQT